ncbi:hypothetical protein M9H77_29783 [Catharanthus roseus]|uniref:Uncharacterized protein n=1 Tax=Catharanthus roseus TaxID=4058 RepID=A0ACB9ZWB0_CATRO|nr:hypothetical protein M9H77_29783 [Catharanthus roseus]
MVSYLEEALKSKLEGFEGQEREQIGEEYAKNLVEPILPPMVSPTLPSPVGFWKDGLLKTKPTANATKSTIGVLHEGGDVRKVQNQIYLQLTIHIKVVSEQPPIEDLDSYCLSYRRFSDIVASSPIAFFETLTPQDWLDNSNIARDIEELNMGKSSAIMEQRFGDNLGGFNSPQ